MSNAGLCNCNVIFKILWIFVSFKPCESITLNVLWYHCLIVIMYLAWRIEQFFHLKMYFTWAAAPVDFCLSRSGCSLNHCNHCLVFYLPHFGMPPPARTAATAKNPCSCLSCYCIWQHQSTVRLHLLKGYFLQKQGSKVFRLISVLFVQSYIYFIQQSAIGIQQNHFNTGQTCVCSVCCMLCVVYVFDRCWFDWKDRTKLLFVCLSWQGAGERWRWELNERILDFLSK